MQLPGFSKRFRKTDTVANPKSGRVAVPDTNTIIGQKAMGCYELIQLIGEGSNGEVYRARVSGHPNMHVVVKRIKPHVMQSPRFRQFFDSEVHSMTRFNHPYAVKLIDASLDDPLGACLVLEYIQGNTLESILTHYNRLTPEHSLRILGQFCHAVQAAHDCGIMHRDLKPANIMVVNLGTAQESIKVMDFGFAGFTEKPHVQLAEITGHGAIFACGTPAYVSPEMIRGDAVDGRADLYSIGVIAYEMLTGRLPFDYPSVEQILNAHIKETPPRFARLGITDVPQAIEAIVAISLSKYPNERMQSAQDFAVALGRSVGWDLWNATMPEGYVPPASQTESIAGNPLMLTPAPSSSSERYVVMDEFEALLSPRMAAAKLRGFVDDVGGEVVESEPGAITMRIDLPEGYGQQKTSSGIFNWIRANRRPQVRNGEEPIEVHMQMQKVDPNRVGVVVTLLPLKEYPPKNIGLWKERCAQVNGILRMYLMASG